MPQRLRLYDCRASRLPSVVGLCQSNVSGIANYVNTAQRRLLYASEGGDEGWWGTWAEVVFNVSRSQPYLTLPREMARIQAITVCDSPVAVQNQFYEYLTFGNGRMPKSPRWRGCDFDNQVYSRNVAPTFIEMASAPQYITAYITDTQDIGKRTLIQGLDTSNNIIYSQDIGNQITGVFLTLNSPSVTTVMQLNQITGIQKDVTVGPVRYYQHDPNTGDEVLLLTMQPSETTASYRRYYFNNLPLNCCSAPGSTQVQVTGLVKLDLIPVVSDTDYLLIQNLEAIIEECQSVRYSEQDNPSAKQMAQERHLQAVRLLNGELNHFVGKDAVAVNFAPFGRARLRNQKIGNML